MYAGHAALALVLRSRYPDVAMLPLAAACYGPDLIETAFMIPTPRAGMAVYTHSIPALVIGALLAAGTYALFTKRRGDALAIFLGWMLHWPADFLTGLKPILGLETRVGLDLYHLPFADFALETACVVAACAVYARRFAPAARERRWVVALGCALIMLQAGLIWALSRLDWGGWNPSLALVRSQTHLASSALFVSPFRTFETPTRPGDAAIGALEARARSMAYGDSSPETTRDDVRELDVL